MEAYLKEFLSIAFVHLLAVASPGPDLAVVLKQSLRFGKKAGLQTAFGIGMGILVHITYILLGFALVLAKNESIYKVFTMLAALYLLYIAYQSLTSKAIRNFGDEVKMEVTEKISFLKTFQIGFFTNALNPKASLFFLSVYTAIVSPQTPSSIQLIYGLYMALATGLWFGLVAAFFGNKIVRNRYLKYSPYIDRAIGILLIILVLYMLLEWI